MRTENGVMVRKDGLEGPNPKDDLSLLHIDNTHQKAHQMSPHVRIIVLLNFRAGHHEPN